MFATNVTICGSVQALLIPPSHNAVIYSLAAGGTISIASLFLAGIIPGLIFGLCLIGLVLWISHRRDYPKGEPIKLREVPRIVIDALWGLVHHRHHHGRHPVGRVHADRVGCRGLRLRVPGDLRRLPRLQAGASCRSWCTAWSRP